MTHDYLAGFRDALDVVLELMEGQESKQEFCEKYGLKPEWDDSILSEIRDHALSVAELYQEMNNQI